MTNNKTLFSLLLLIVPSFAFAAGDNSSFLYAMMSIGFVTILFGIYALIRSGAAMKALTTAAAGATPVRHTPTTGNDHIVMATGDSDGTSSGPTPDEGFTGTDFSGGLDIFDDEKDLLMNHEYDGIQELNNKLPPWWVGLFYVTIAFACIYPFVFHEDHDVMFKAEMAAADAEVAAYVKSHGGAVSVDNVTLLEDDVSLAAGKKLFDANCVACHLADGGGTVGPNLTDEYWIHGGGIKNVFKVISNGGRPGKGMVAWKTTMSGKERQQVASYVWGKLHGSTPAAPKEKEGELYKPE